MSIDSSKSRSSNIGQLLQAELDQLVAEIQATEFFRTLTAPNADPQVIASTLKYVYLSIHHYQPHVTEATFTAVGRMPKHSERQIKNMIRQQVEEVEHADMALRDYTRLGGDPAFAAGPMPPECAAVAAMCHFLGEHCPAACYLGFMYIFEALTPIMARQAQQVMQASNYKPEAREFVDLHATEDIRHTDMILAVIQQLLRIQPEAFEQIIFGFRAFKAVYPIPVWTRAYEHALNETRESLQPT
ncbi:MAG TPA: iron-containing redox enzyme family protein [Candidatus Didemnitutus sp.]|nr:iron-containing redox enzyme family protein [Candidatus Didemnitutus sp.]